MISTVKFGDRRIYFINGVISDELTFRRSTLERQRKIWASLLLLGSLNMGMFFYTSGRSYAQRISYHLGGYRTSLASFMSPKYTVAERTTNLLPLSGNMEDSMEGFLRVSEISAKETAIPSTQAVAALEPLLAKPVHSAASAGRPERNPYLDIQDLRISVPIRESSPDTKAINKALEKGIIRWPASDALGEGGITILLGHSSAPLSYKGAYGSVFALLDKLVPGSVISIKNSDTTLYYRVRDHRIINPKKVQEDVLDGLDGEGILLVSCWPVGTNWQRIAVWAQRFEP